MLLFSFKKHLSVEFIPQPSSDVESPACDVTTEFLSVKVGPNERPGGGRHRPLARPHRWRPWKGQPRAWQSQVTTLRGQHRSRPIRPRGRHFSLVGFGLLSTSRENYRPRCRRAGNVVAAIGFAAATARTSTARVVAALRRPTAGTARSASTSAAYSPQNGSPPSGRFALAPSRVLANLIFFLANSTGPCTIAR